MNISERKVNKSLLAAAMLACCWSASPAAADDLEVVVTATRIAQPAIEVPVTVNVLTREDISAASVANIGEALILLPGVAVRSQGSIGSLSSIGIRGASSSQVLILLDGRPLNSAQSGVVDLADIPLANVERIELLRGPASALYGAYAMGGVVNIITGKGGLAGTDISLTGGEMGTSIYSLAHSGGDGRTSYLVTAGHTASDGYRPNSAYDTESASGRVDVRLNPNAELTLSMQAYHAAKGIPGMESYPTPLAMQWNDNNSIALTYSGKHGGSADTILLYRNRENLAYKDDDPFWPVDTRHINKAMGITAQRTSPLGSGHLIYGFDLRRDDIDSLDLGVRTADAASAYLQSDFSAGKALTLTAGGRYDSHSIYGSQFSPRLGANYRVGGTVLRASVGRGFRPPVFQDLYWPYQFSSYPDWADPALRYEYITRGNADLRPEQSTAWEVSLERDVFKGSLRTTLFRQNVRDLIRWVADYSSRTEGSETIYTYDYAPVNIASALMQGAEMEYSRNILPSLTGFINYTWLDARDNVSDSRLPYSPDNTLSAGLRYAGPQGLTIALNGRSSGRQLVAVGSDKTIPGYTRFDLRASRPVIGKASLVLNVDNIFNVRYYEQDGYPMPGRTFSAGITWGF